MKGQCFGIFLDMRIRAGEEQASEFKEHKIARKATRIECDYLRARVYAIRSSTAPARSGPSSTMLSPRICSRLCRMLSCNLTTAGYSLGSTVGVFEFSFALFPPPLAVAFLVETDCDDSKAEARSRSRSILRDRSWNTMKACKYCRSLVPAMAGAMDEPDVYVQSD